jgi:hypothetical protein
MNILTLDLELAPRIATVWRPGQQYIGVDQLLKDTAILSAAVKVRGKRAEALMTADTNPSDLRDDYAVCGWLYEHLRNADLIIAHNGARFDMPVIRERMASHGFPAFRMPKLHDTFIMYSKVMQGASGKLAWLSQKFSRLEKSEHGKFAGNKLWDAYMAGNPEAWAEMKHYNVRDVEATEQVWETLVPWWTVQRPPVSGAEGECPTCGAPDHQQRESGTVRPGAVYTYQMHECGKCGSFHRGSKAL